MKSTCPDEYVCVCLCTENRPALVFMARTAETAERYDDMCKIMRELVVSSSQEELTVEERNLLSVAYKNVIGSRRAAWRTLNAGNACNTTHTHMHIHAHTHTHDSE